MDRETKTMLNAILDEMGRMEGRINKKFEAVDARFDRLESRMDIMQHEINACKLERESISLLIQKIDEHEERITKLERRTA
ncbi:MAG: hypothetical protein NC416_11575 [Eubacterium sp.]|nr:hypothetical protein [Eubacterium sp.]